jgi:hypothetical protein
MIENNNKLINQNDFFENLKIFYVEETKKLHIALYNTFRTNFGKDKENKYYQNNELDDLNANTIYEEHFNKIGEKLQNSFEEKYGTHQKNISGAKKPKKVKRYLDGVSSLAALFNLIEEFIFNEEYSDIELALGNASTSLNTVVGAESKINKIGGIFKSKKIKIGNVKRFSEVFTIVTEAAIQRQNFISGKKSQANFDSNSTNELAEKILGENYIEKVKNLPIRSIVSNAISGRSDLKGIDYQYEIQLDSNSQIFTELKEFLNTNPSNKNLNGIRTVDSKLFIEKFFSKFIEENLVNSEIDNNQIINNGQIMNKNNISNNDEEFYDVQEDLTEESNNINQNIEVENPNIEVDTQYSSNSSNNQNINTTSITNDDISDQSTLNNNRNSTETSTQSTTLDENSCSHENTARNQTKITDSASQDNKKSSIINPDINQSDKNKDNKNSNSLVGIIKKLVEFLKNLFKKSEFKKTLSEIKSTKKDLIELKKQIDSTNQNQNQDLYTNRIIAYNTLLEAYGKYLVKANEYIKKSNNCNNEKQFASRKLRLEKITEGFNFQSIDISVIA